MDLFGDEMVIKIEDIVSCVNQRSCSIIIQQLFTVTLYVNKKISTQYYINGENYLVINGTSVCISSRSVFLLLPEYSATAG